VQGLQPCLFWQALKGPALRTINVLMALIVVIAIAVVGFGLPGKIMHDPAEVTSRSASRRFFGDARSAPCARARGRWPRGQLHDDPLLETGKIGNTEATIFPFFAWI